MSHMSWAYVTGFFDAEGWVSRTKNNTYDIGIAQTSLPVLRSIVKFMGFGYIRRRPRQHVNHKTCYVILIRNHRDQLHFIDNVLTYSIVKHNVLSECRAFIVEKNWDADKTLQNVDKKLLVLGYEKGVSLARLAKKYHVSVSSIRYHLKRLRVHMRPSCRPCSVNKKELILSYLRGAGTKDLAAKYGIGFTGIRRHLHALGIKPMYGRAHPPISPAPYIAHLSGQ